MTFKEKHFKQAFGPILLATMMLLPSGCGKVFKGNSDAGRGEGLLDPTPVEVKDYYGTNVALSQVDIPVFDGEGNRLKDRWVVTHGLANSGYEADMSVSTLRRVYLNDGDEPSYVQVDANNAIMSENGGCGLFLDGHKIVVVSDVNLNKYIGKRTAKLVLPQSRPARKPMVLKKEETPAPEITAPTDSVAAKDTIVNKADTLKDSIINKAVIDTLQNNLE